VIGGARREIVIAGARSVFRVRLQVEDGSNLSLLIVDDHVLFAEVPFDRRRPTSTSSASRSTPHRGAARRGAPTRPAPVDVLGR
jgi:hypothetical protein